MDRVIGVDVVPPRGDIGDVSFVRADIRNPVIAKVIAKENVDTVVHMSVISTPGSAGGRGTMKELNVIGTMQLLAACQKAPSVQHLVVKSTTTMYGASNRDPAMFTEDMEPRRGARSGYAKDVAEIEGYVRGFARRRPDVRVTTLRCANVIGPHVVSPLTSYFRLPVIPTVLGFDARLQFLHEQDLMDVLQPRRPHRPAGHLQRRRRRHPDALPGAAPAAAAVGARCPASRSAASARCSAVPGWPTSLRNSSASSPTVAAWTPPGCATQLGFEPAFTTAEAFADFAAGLTPDRRPDRAGAPAALDQLPPVEEPRRSARWEAVDRG